MNNRDRTIINKIIRYCEDVEKIMGQYQNEFSKYQEEIAFQYACNMCIIQIGELVGRLSAEFMEEHGEIPWRAIKGMRNLHAHDYENVDLEIVWNTLVEEIPNLERKLKGIIVQTRVES